MSKRSWPTWRRTSKVATSSASSATAASGASMASCWRESAEYEKTEASTSRETVIGRVYQTNESDRLSGIQRCGDSAVHPGGCGQRASLYLGRDREPLGGLLL